MSARRAVVEQSYTGIAHANEARLGAGTRHAIVRAHRSLTRIIVERLLLFLIHRDPLHVADRRRGDGVLVTAVEHTGDEDFALAPL